MSKKKRRKIAKNADSGVFKPQKSTQCCKNCRFFDIDFIETDEDRRSWCQRFPPVYVGPSYETLSQTCDVPADAYYWEQPTVGIMNWCGEWRQRKE